jgi:hypothetical protein
MQKLSYKEKFESLKPWAFGIITEIKRELKTEHLRKETAFALKHFARKPIDKLTVAELTAAYMRDIEEGNEETGEWVASRWMLKHSEVYQFFAERLSAINPQFDEITILEDDVGKKLVDEAVTEFGAKITYVFSILNAVAFSEELFRELRQKIDLTQTGEEISQSAETQEELKQRYENALLKVTDKYEKKLLGFQKKYTQDVDGLKKQIAALQRKLAVSNGSR